MQKILVFGASGNLGKMICQALKKEGYWLRIVVRSNISIPEIDEKADEKIMLDFNDEAALSCAVSNIDVIISALGKSVSLFDFSKPGFEDIDLKINLKILLSAAKLPVKKFIYISALGAELYPELTYFKAHESFSEALRNSGLKYTVIQPPALFSAFQDLVILSKKGLLFSVLGNGQQQTNPISEKDLAIVVTNAIHTDVPLIKAGGKYIYTRLKINQLINKNNNKRNFSICIPFWLMSGFLPIVRWFDRNLYDKLAFYTAVFRKDVLAPPIGETSLETYLEELKKNG